MEGTSTDEDLLKREIEDLPVMSSLSFIRVIGRDKAGYCAKLRCHVASSHGGCTDGSCTVKQVGPIRMSTKHPTMLDYLRELPVNERAASRNANDVLMLRTKLKSLEEHVVITKVVCFISHS